MKRILLSIVGVLAVLWVALFVSGQQVLVWEEKKEPFISDDPPITMTREEVLKKYPSATEEQIAATLKKYNKPTLAYEEVLANMDWSCTYFNSRRFVTKEYSSSRTACPNFRKNR